MRVHHRIRKYNIIVVYTVTIRLGLVKKLTKPTRTKKKH